LCLFKTQTQTQKISAHSLIGAGQFAYRGDRNFPCPKARLRLAQSRGMMFSVGSFANEFPLCNFSRWTLCSEFQEW